MLVLTHQGPGYRSKLLPKAEALSLAARFRGDDRYAGVQTLESTRARHAVNRCFVVCLPAAAPEQEELLRQFQQVRIERAYEEGPRYLWLADPAPPVWHVLALSGATYTVDPEHSTCTCRDAGVCADNGLACKHVVAFHAGLGTYVTSEQFARLRLLAAKLGQPAPARLPVALPIAA